MTKHLQRDEILENLAKLTLARVCYKGPDVKVFWDTRMRTTAGRAYVIGHRIKKIHLNPKLKTILDGSEIQRTFRHELAHILAHHRAGRKKIQAHGKEWREACVDLGIPGESRCHDLPLERVTQKRKFFYLCINCGDKHARVQKLKKVSACIECCRAYNNGVYHPNFRLVSVPKEKYDRVQEAESIAA